MELNKTWLIPERIALSPAQIAAAGDAVLAEILYRRGFRTPEAIKTFLDIEAYRPAELGDHPLVQAVVERIDRAVRAGEKICVYGDYDVDGVTATALWVETLEHLGAAVIYHVPDRFEEGYGMNMAVLTELARSGIRLIITCDCGITNHAEIAHAQASGMDVVVTDHHELPPELPEAAAVFNPKMLAPGHPAYFLPGVGTAYIAAKALLARYHREEKARELLDLVALGIIADVVPLAGDCRYYLAKGLPHVLNPARPGLKALAAAAKLHPAYSCEEDVAFQLAPRLNAAGRLESARLAVDLLLTRDEDAARALAERLDAINLLRRQYCDAIMDEAQRRIAEQCRGVPAIVLCGEGWHEGVIGIVAGRMAEQYGVPAILMAVKEDGRTVTGSARSVPGIHMYEVLQACRDLLIKFGGHEGAAGFSLEREKVEAFRERLYRILAESGPTGAVATVAAAVDAVLDLRQVTPELYFTLRRMAPFGEGNPPPVFLLEGEVVSVRPVSNGQHRRLIIRQQDVALPAIWWRSAEQAVPAGPTRFLCTLRLETYNGRGVQVDIQAVFPEDMPVPAAAPSGREIIDGRGLDWQELARMFPGAQVYYEGGDFPWPARNRLGITVCETLVLAALPPSRGILTEILALAQPRRVVLAWQPPAPRKVREVITQLMGVVKFAVLRRDGQAAVSQLAAWMGEADGVVWYGLNLLAEQQLIMMDAVDGDTCRLALGRANARLSPENHTLRRLQHLVEEGNAFRRYLHGAGGQALEQLLGGKQAEIKR